MRTPHRRRATSALASLLAMAALVGVAGEVLRPGHHVHLDGESALHHHHLFAGDHEHRRDSGDGSATTSPWAWAFEDLDHDPVHRGHQSHQSHDGHRDDASRESEPSGEAPSGDAPGQETLPGLLTALWLAPPVLDVGFSAPVVPARRLALEATEAAFDLSARLPAGARAPPASSLS